MKDYKLLTPGPLTTTATVKQEMLFDHCTWDDDYKKITLKISDDAIAENNGKVIIFSLLILLLSYQNQIRSVASY